MANVVTQQMLDAYAEAEETRQKEVLLARKFMEGDHGAPLNDRQKEYLAYDSSLPEMNLNMYSVVITSVAERLRITGWTSPDENAEEGVKWAESVWRDAKLASVQQEVHEDCLNEGETFLFCSWDIEEDIPSVVQHDRFVDVALGGTGTGCVAHYENNDPRQKLLAVDKFDLEIDEKGNQETIRTRYYSYKVVRSKQTATGWEVIDEKAWTKGSDETTAVPTGEEEDLEPLGIAIIHFKNTKLKCEAWKAIPPQLAVNKTWLDLMAGADLTAFRVYVALGFIPTTDGKPPADDQSNWLTVHAGQVIGTSKPKTQADFKAIDAADLASLITAVHQNIVWGAMVTETPVSRFVSTKLIASEDTLKQQEEPLYARVDDKQVLFTDPWVQVIKTLRMLQNEFGESGQVNEEVTFTPIWRTSRDLEYLLEMAQKKEDIGVPAEVAIAEVGYSAAEVKKMLGKSNTQEVPNGEEE